MGLGFTASKVIIFGGLREVEIADLLTVALQQPAAFTFICCFGVFSPKCVRKVWKLPPPTPSAARDTTF